MINFKLWHHTIIHWIKKYSRRVVPARIVPIWASTPLHVPRCKATTYPLWFLNLWFKYRMKWDNNATGNTKLYSNEHGERITMIFKIRIDIYFFILRCGAFMFILGIYFYVCHYFCRCQIVIADSVACEIKLLLLW